MGGGGVGEGERRRQQRVSASATRKREPATGTRRLPTRRKQLPLSSTPAVTLRGHERQACTRCKMKPSCKIQPSCDTKPGDTPRAPQRRAPHVQGVEGGVAGVVRRPVVAAVRLVGVELAHLAACGRSVVGVKFTVSARAVVKTLSQKKQRPSNHPGTLLALEE